MFAASLLLSLDVKVTSTLSYLHMFQTVESSSIKYLLEFYNSISTVVHVKNVVQVFETKRKCTYMMIGVLCLMLF